MNNRRMTSKNVGTQFSPRQEFDLGVFLFKSDLLLYKKILLLIDREWDTIDSQRFGDFMEKLGELHHNLEKVVHSQNVSRTLRTNHSLRESIDTNRLSKLSLKRILQTITE